MDNLYIVKIFQGGFITKHLLVFN